MSTNVTDSFLDLFVNALTIALYDGDNMLTEREMIVLDTLIEVLDQQFPDWLDEILPNPEDGDGCFADEFFDPEEDN